MSEPPLRVMLDGDRFRVRRPLGPPGLLRGVSAVAVDQDRRVLVLQRQGPPIVVLQPDGAVEATLGQGLVVDGHGLATGAEGTLLVVDRDAHEVLVLEPDGAVRLRLGRRHQPSFAAPFNHPAAAAQAPDGTYLVADGYGNSQIHRFDDEGRHLDTWGLAAADAGAGLSTPHGIAVGPDGTVHVADREHDQVVQFDPSGRVLGRLRDVYRPMDLVVTDDGTVVVSDQVPRLSAFREGRLVGRCRAAASAGHGLARGPDGTWYVAEPPPADRITVLEPEDEAEEQGPVPADREAAG